MREEGVMGVLRHGVAVAIALAFVVGCKVGPDYVRPDIETPGIGGIDGHLLFVGFPQPSAIVEDRMSTPTRVR